MQMSNSKWENILQLIKQAHYDKKISTAVISKQTRFRQEKIDLILESELRDLNLDLSDKRLIQALANFYSIDPDLIPELDNDHNLPITHSNRLGLDSVNSPKPKRRFFWFTYSNLNFIGVSLLVTFVLALVFLPAYIVARPAELIWDESISANQLIFSQPRQIFTGHTYRAKEMRFGGQVVKLINGRFQLDLPKPEKPTPVPLELTNYFNFKTTYMVLLN
ncbi:MAG: hypothetical protein OHK0017_13190 [Patescibacteria group bacterium]